MAIIIIAVVSFILFQFISSNNNNSKKPQVGIHTYMDKKYQFLIKQLTDHPEARITKVTTDQITIQAKNASAITTYIITESFNGVKIDWIAKMSSIGNYNHSWNFPLNYPQERMLEEMMEYLMNKRSDVISNL